MQKKVLAVKHEPWAFRCYKKESGQQVIDIWFAGLTKKGRARLDAVLLILRDQPKSNWLRPHSCSIGNNIYVIHFKDENSSQWRPVGNFLDEYKSFVITTEAIERGGEYKPKDYIAIAESRRDQVCADPEKYSSPCFPHISMPVVLAPVHGVHARAGGGDPACKLE